MTKPDNHKRIQTSDVLPLIVPQSDYNDAVWLARLAKEGQTMQTDTMQRRLLAIARRLNGGKAVKP